MEILFSSPEYWLIFGAILFAAEMLIPSRLLLLLGVVAIGVGVILTLWREDSLAVQFFMVVLLLITNVIVEIRLKHKAKKNDAQNAINSGIYALRGRNGIAVENFSGNGRIYIADTFYPAFSLLQIHKDEHVFVVDVKGGVLIVEPIEHG